MNQIYKKNVIELAKQDPGLVIFLDSLATENYEITNSSTSEPQLFVKRHDEKIIQIGSGQSPVIRAKQIVPVLPKKRYFFIVFGIGLGQLFFELHKTYPESVFLVVEFDGRIFKKALETFDFSRFFNVSSIGFVVALIGFLIPLAVVIGVPFAIFKAVTGFRLPKIGGPKGRKPDFGKIPNLDD